MKKKIQKSSVTGRFVSDEDMKQNPESTYVQSVENKIAAQERGERIYRATIEGLPPMNADTPVTLALLEFQKSLRRALIADGLLSMIKVDGEWTVLDDSEPMRTEVEAVDHHPV